MDGRIYYFMCFCHEASSYLASRFVRLVQFRESDLPSPPLLFIIEIDPNPPAEGNRKQQAMFWVTLRANAWRPDWEASENRFEAGRIGNRPLQSPADLWRTLGSLDSCTTKSG